MHKLTDQQRRYEQTKQRRRLRRLHKEVARQAEFSKRKHTYHSLKKRLRNMIGQYLIGKVSWGGLVRKSTVNVERKKIEKSCITGRPDGLPHQGYAECERRRLRAW